MIQDSEALKKIEESTQRRLKELEVRIADIDNEITESKKAINELEAIKNAITEVEIKQEKKSKEIDGIAKELEESKGDNRRHEG